MVALLGPDCAVLLRPCHECKHDGRRGHTCSCQACNTGSWLVQTVYASIPENRQLDHTLGFGSGSSGKSQQGSGHLGSGHLGSGHLGSGQLSGQLGLNLTQGSGQLGSGVLGMNRSQGSGQFAQLVGQGRSGSGVPGWLGSGSGQFGSPHLSGAGQGRAESPFAQHHDQQFQNTGQSVKLLANHALQWQHEDRTAAHQHLL